MNKIEEPRFEFGKNWHEFITKNYGPQKVEISKHHMLDFMGKKNLDGLTFLDIGCGSGLHSVAALQAGAAQVHSFDYDANSVEASNYVRSLTGNSSVWTVEQGSVLDDDFMNNLAQFAVVYSWGVLHHTGDVWHAIRNTAERVKPGGLLYLALYSADVQVDPPPEFWLAVKQSYVAGGALKRRLMEFWYVWRFLLQKKISNFPGFIRRLKTYEQTRGMNLFTDIRDWIGGWPMEFVYDADAIRVCEGYGFTLKKIVTGEANTEFLFHRNFAGENSG